MSTTSNPVPAAPVATPEEVKSFRAEQEKEWGQYVAVQPISFNGALAYNPGDPVPAANVAKYGYADQGLVAKAGSKAAGETAAALHLANTTQGEALDLGANVTLGVVVPEGK